MVQLTGAAGIDAGQYKLKIGSSAFELVPSYDDPDVKEEKIRIFFTIVGDDDWDGAEFSDLFSQTFGKKSKLGQLARAAFKTEDLPSSWDTDELEGKSITASIKLSDSGYNSLIVGTIVPVKAKAKTAEAKPAKVEEEDDPFAEDEEVA